MIPTSPRLHFFHVFRGCPIFSTEPMKDNVGIAYLPAQSLSCLPHRHMAHDLREENLFTLAQEAYFYTPQSKPYRQEIFNLTLWLVHIQKPVRMVQVYVRMIGLPHVGEYGFSGLKGG